MVKIRCSGKIWAIGQRSVGLLMDYGCSIDGFLTVSLMVHLVDCLMDDGWILGDSQNPCTRVFTSSTVAGIYGYIP